MISAIDLRNAFRQALDEKWGYIWGTRGQTWTQKQQDAATRDMTIKYGSKWIGRKVADCSGLFVWAYKLYNESIYHGSNTIFNKYCSETGPVAGVVKIRTGTAVFQNSDGKRGHIGLYIGGGMCIEAKGTQHGVVSSPLSVWDEWGTLKQVDYSNTIVETFGIIPLETLTKGAKGELVKYLQRALAKYGIKDDGIFGDDTLSAVRAFQHDNGLSPDGKVGPKTWPAVKAAYEDDEPTEDTEVDFDEIVGPESDPEQDAWNTLSIEEKVENLHKRVLTLEGGESNG